MHASTTITGTTKRRSRMAAAASAVLALLGVATLRAPRGASSVMPMLRRQLNAAAETNGARQVVVAAAALKHREGNGSANAGARRTDKCNPPKDGEPPKDDMVLVVMCNKSQAERVAWTVRRVRNKGKYTGDVVVMHSEDDLPEADAAPFFSGLEVQFKSFPRNVDKYKVPEDLPGHGPVGPRGHNQDTAWVYFMKFNVFDPYFAEHWCRVLYMDGGIHAFGDLTQYLESVYPTEKLYAHSDAYPASTWKLSGQFADLPSHPKAKEELTTKYDMEVDYPQSTLLYFNTQTVIASDPGVKDKLFEMQRNYPVGTSLDQPYIALYYTNVNPIWEELPEIEANGEKKRLYAVSYTHLRAHET